MKAPKIISDKIVYSGFNKIHDVELQAPSLHPDKNYSALLRREVMACSDAVVVLIHAPDINSFILLREFRTGVFFNKAGDDPFIYQCVAGMIDKGKSPEETACMEVSEETGLTAGKLTKIAVVYASPGRMTERVHLFYTEIEGTPQTGLYGLADKNEEIITEAIPRERIYQMMDAMEIIDSMALLALNWFRANENRLKD